MVIANAARPVAALSIAAAFLLCAGCGEGQKQASAPPPPTVTVAKPIGARWSTRTNMSAASSPSIASKYARASPAICREIHFTDGQLVKKGDLLFTIDQRPFQIALEQMRANLAQARANLAFTEADLARGQELVRNKTMTEQIYDQRKQAKSVAEAARRGAGGDGASGRARPQRIFRTARADRRPHRRSPRLRRQSGDRRQRLQYHVARHHRLGRSDPLRIHLRRSILSALSALRRRGRQDGERRDGGMRSRSSSSTSRISVTPAGWISSTTPSTNPRARSAAARYLPTRTDSSPRACSAAFACPVRRRTPALLVPDAAIGTEQSRKFVLVVDDEQHRPPEICDARPARRRLARDQRRPGRGRSGDRQRPDARAPGRQGNPAGRARRPRRREEASKNGAQTKAITAKLGLHPLVPGRRGQRLRGNARNVPRSERP